VADNYAANGGQPDGKGYTPNPGSGDCYSFGCYSAIDGTFVPAPPVVKVQPKMLCIGGIAGGCHVQMQASQAHSVVRVPDFISFSVPPGVTMLTWLVWRKPMTSVTVTKYGDVFDNLSIVNGGASNDGPSTSIAGLPLSGDDVVPWASAGWIDQSSPPSRTTLNNLLSGPSVSVTGGARVGDVPVFAQETWENPGHLGSGNFSTQLGVGGDPGLSAELSTSWQLQKRTWSWLRW
jgi:hypothetical protein